jgi:hypothetical protein
MASGYDLSSRVPFRLMKGRLGVYDKRPFDPAGATAAQLEQQNRVAELMKMIKNMNIDLDATTIQKIEDLLAQDKIDEAGIVLTQLDPKIEGIWHQATRFGPAGGNRQQERMIRDKRRSLDHAVWNSYQAAEVLRVDAENRKPVRALINPNKLKQDYDDKIISVGFEYNFKCGDVFEWLGTKTHWLIYLQDLTELAYFRGDIRKCSYQIAWEDEDGIHTTYAAVRGPVETKINFIQKHGISIDTPNHSLSILMPKNEYTMKYFKRYSKFYLQGDDTCWRVEASDWISTPGILEVIAVEYYANETEDDVDNGIVGGLIEPIKDPNGEVEEVDIIGDTFIKVKKLYDYEFSGTIADEWIVDSKYPVELIHDPSDPRRVSLRWTSTFSGQFDLHYGDYTKTIVVESLF